MSSVENSVDELEQKADSYNAVLTGTTTVNGPALLNGPVTFGNSITGIDISDVKDLQTALDAKAIQSTTYTKTEADDLLSAKADKTTTYTKGDVDQNISNLIASAPDALNTLNELAQALANDPSYVATVINQLTQKADKSTTYTKTEVDNALSAKANQSTTYTKTEVDNALSAKQPSILPTTSLSLSK